MKKIERDKARKLRAQGLSINEITERLGVAKSSVSVWVRDIELDECKKRRLKEKGYYQEAVESRRKTRLENEKSKRELIIEEAKKSISKLTEKELWLVGVMLYWAEGGKTQRLVRFSNGDPEMIKIMMAFFRKTCETPEKKFRGYIHIHPHLDHLEAEKYWSAITSIPLDQFFKTYRKPNKSSQSKKNSLPYGVLDIYVLDTKLFLKITGWSQGIFGSY